jgi:asparagine synthase (glutamine-hydrolysing)
MKYFVCLLDTTGTGIADEICRQYDSLPRIRGLSFHWQRASDTAVLVAGDEVSSEACVARDGTWTAAGIVRLDNRSDLEQWAGGEARDLTDLELVLRVTAQHGTRYIGKTLGDFAFVAWSSSTRTAVAACDVFAVRRLFYVKRNGLLAFASRAEALALGERYEVEYLARLVALQWPARDLSVYAGVRALPAASMAVADRGKLTVRRYWTATDIEVRPSGSLPETEAVETCRQLLCEAVRLRFGKPGTTWAQLSGGLDSSSLVSIAQWLAARGEVEGLAGTVTYVDRQGTPVDEREFSDAVVQRWDVRNEVILDPPTWYDDEFALPTMDQPTLDISVYPRDRRMCAVVQKAGGRVLLTGWGGDELWTGSMLFFADWLAQGRFITAAREIARRAAIGRVSFWELAYKNAILPLLPRPLQQHLISDDYVIQPWLNSAALRRHGVTLRTPLAPEYAGPWGGKYRHAIETRINELPAVTDRGVVADSVDVRHPMLYRPLCEFAAGLPPELRAKPQVHRWLLREAVRGILPDKVRTRIGKPGTGDVVAMSLMAERRRLAQLLNDPILAELQIVDARKLRAAFDSQFEGGPRQGYSHSEILSTLAVEAWLQMRCGRWPRGGHRSSKEGRMEFAGS